MIFDSDFFLKLELRLYLRLLGSFVILLFIFIFTLFSQFFLTFFLLDLLLQASELLIELRLRRHLPLLQMQVSEYICERDWLRKCKVHRVVVMLESVMELQRIVIEDFPLLRLLLFRDNVRGKVPRLLGRPVDINIWQLLISRFARSSILVIGLESFLDPFFLVGVRPGRDDVLLATSHICFDVVAIGERLPLTKIIDQHRVLL